MTRETETVRARDLRDGNLGHPQDELTGGRGKVTKILGDTGLLTIYTESGAVVRRDLNGPIERFVRACRCSHGQSDHTDGLGRCHNGPDTCACLGYDNGSQS